ncbi:MAG: ABC transporter ATP-binding protein [Hyphomicrobiales bacterium]|nr:ABC transporter ATP-binding protein [Hyphomicrobiales bacterium]
MARIHLEQVGHSYGGGTYALEKADLVFEEGLTYALLGPSGCGKTTMLNIISGLVRPSDGRVLVGGTDMTDVPTVRRNIAQVFQFPVVYRSKTVFENLAFPLRCRGWNTTRLRPRVEEIAELLGMSKRLGQSARNLTADEKQLVSLGRGLVREDVAALLMDEPLTVIDPQMKSDLRRRIKQANARTRHTVVYVTHDQNEAMTFADEVLVMRAGRVVQRGGAQELFENPRDTYVGTFIGSPGMNFMAAERIGGRIGFAGVALLPATAANEVPDAADLRIGIRPEHLAFSNDGEQGIPASVNFVQDQGSFLIVDLTVASQTIKVKVRREVRIPSGPARLSFPAERLRLYADGALLTP